jgi:hypothetical protein
MFLPYCQRPCKQQYYSTIIYNSMLRLSYFPVTWKFAQIVMLPKPGKPANETSSYRPIILLPIPSKIFEKLLLNRIRNDTDILGRRPWWALEAVLKLARNQTMTFQSVACYHID